MTTSTITMLLVDADDTIAAIERARDALERAKADAACQCCGDACPYAAHRLVPVGGSRCCGGRVTRADFARVSGRYRWRSQPVATDTAAAWLMREAVTPLATAAVLVLLAYAVAL
jgi:hypothetical protein